MSNLKKIGLVCSAGLLISMAFANGYTSDEPQSNTEQTQATAPSDSNQSASYAAGQKFGGNINKATGATVDVWHKTSVATVDVWHKTSGATVGFWNNTTGSVTNWWDGVTKTVKDPTE